MVASTLVKWARRSFVGLSLTVAAGAAGMWVTTHWRAFNWTSWGHCSWRVTISHGAVAIRWQQAELRQFADGSPWNAESRAGPSRPTVPVAWPEIPLREHTARYQPRAVHAALGGTFEWRNGFVASLGPPTSGLPNDTWVRYTDFRGLRIPLMGVALLAIIPALAAGLRRMAVRQHASGHCVACG